MVNNKYEVEYKVVGLYKNGKYHPKAVLHEKTTYKRLNNKGILRGAKSFKKDLNAIYGKNLKKFKIRKIQ